MKFVNTPKQFISVWLLTCWLWLLFLPTVSAVALESSQSLPLSEATLISSTDNWAEIDQQLVEALESAYSNTENFASRELDRWVAKRAENIDHPFLDWYFNFFHQKITQIGVPFAWLALKMDGQLKLFQSEEEKTKNLNTDEIINRRMQAEMRQKFADMVLNEEALSDIKDIVERTAQNYASAIGVGFAKVKSRYRVPDQDWENHMDALSQMITNTATQGLGLPGSALSGMLTEKILLVTAASAGTKLTASLVTKSTSKLLAKGGSVIAAKWGATLVDPVVGLGLIVWEIWSYKANVAKNRPQMRANLVGYITQLRNGIQDGGNGIMDAILDLQNDFVRQLQPSYS